VEVALGWVASVGTAVGSTVGAVVDSCSTSGSAGVVGSESSVGTLVGSPVSVGTGVLTVLQAASRSAASGKNNNLVFSIAAFTTSLLS
jgi:hypothetical protein